MIRRVSKLVGQIHGNKCSKWYEERCINKQALIHARTILTMNNHLPHHTLHPHPHPHPHPHHPAQAEPLGPSYALLSSSFSLGILQALPEH